MNSWVDEFSIFKDINLGRDFIQGLVVHCLYADTKREGKAFLGDSLK